MTMTTTSYSSVYTASRGHAAAERNGMLRRFLDRLVEARMARAESFIRANSHLIPRELEDQAAWKVTDRSEGSLPFIR